MAAPKSSERVCLWNNLLLEYSFGAQSSESPMVYCCQLSFVSKKLITWNSIISVWWINQMVPVEYQYEFATTISNSLKSEWIYLLSNIVGWDQSNDIKTWHDFSIMVGSCLRKLWKWTSEITKINNLGRLWTSATADFESTTTVRQPTGVRRISLNMQLWTNYCENVNQQPASDWFFVTHLHGVPKTT